MLSLAIFFGFLSSVSGLLYVTLEFQNTGTYDYEYGSGSVIGPQVEYTGEVAGQDYLLNTGPGSAGFAVQIILNTPTIANVTIKTGWGAQVQFQVSATGSAGAYYGDTTAAASLGGTMVPSLNSFSGQNPNGFWYVLVDGLGQPLSLSFLSLRWLLDNGNNPAPDPSALTVIISLVPKVEATTKKRVYITLKGSLSTFTTKLSNDGIALGQHTFTYPVLYIGTLTQVIINTYSSDKLEIQTVSVTQVSVTQGTVQFQGEQSPLTTQLGHPAVFVMQVKG